MDHIIRAVLAKRPQDLVSLLRKTPALAALRFDHEFLVEEIPHQFYVGDTPLHLAAAAIRLPAVKALVDAGADVDAANRRGARPLHYACDPRPSHDTSWRPEEQESVMRLLLAHGADADASDKTGVMPLHRAVRARSPVTVRVLIEAGCNVWARAGKAGSTPLHLAMGPTGASGTAGRMDLQVEIIELLVRRGAKLTDVDGQGEAAIDRIRSASLRQALSKLGMLP